MNDYSETEIVALTAFTADLCAKCIGELDNLVFKFCGKKKGGE
jgi:hypothetical protein